MVYYYKVNSCSFLITALEFYTLHMICIIKHILNAIISTLHILMHHMYKKLQKKTIILNK